MDNLTSLGTYVSVGYAIYNAGKAVVTQNYKPVTDLASTALSAGKQSVVVGKEIIRASKRLIGTYQPTNPSHGVEEVKIDAT